MPSISTHSIFQSLLNITVCEAVGATAALFTPESVRLLTNAVALPLSRTHQYAADNTCWYQCVPLEDHASHAFDHVGELASPALRMIKHCLSGPDIGSIRRGGLASADSLMHHTVCQRFTAKTRSSITWRGMRSALQQPAAPASSAVVARRFFLQMVAAKVLPGGVNISSPDADCFK